MFEHTTLLIIITSSVILNTYNGKCHSVLDGKVLLAHHFDSYIPEAFLFSRNTVAHTTENWPIATHLHDIYPDNSVNWLS